MSLSRTTSQLAEDASAASRGAKSAAAFRTISEVAAELDVPAHVLRFWESKFPQIKPLKRGGGRRYYRPEDVDLLRRIRLLLYRDGYTIKGAQKLLRTPGVRDTDDGVEEMAAVPVPVAPVPVAPVSIAPVPRPAVSAARPIAPRLPVAAASIPLFAPSIEAGAVPLDQPARKAIEQVLAELADIRDLLRSHI